MFYLYMLELFSSHVRAREYFEIVSATRPLSLKTF